MSRKKKGMATKVKKEMKNKNKKCFLCDGETTIFSHTISNSKLIVEKYYHFEKITKCETIDDLNQFEKMINVFNLICANCDKKEFEEYEKYFNIDDWEQTELRQVALKTLLYEYYFQLYNIKVLEEYHKNGIKYSSGEIEGRKYTINIIEKKISKIKEGNGYTILFNEVIDIKGLYATLCFAPMFDTNGNIVNKLYDQNIEELMHYYLMIVPENEKTRVLFYKDNNNIEEKTRDLNVILDFVLRYKNTIFVDSENIDILIKENLEKYIFLNINHLPYIPKNSIVTRKREEEYISVYRKNIYSFPFIKIIDMKNILK